MDYYDRAAELEALSRDIALATRKQEGPAPTGYCLNCGETVSPGHRWCEVACREDWEARRRAKREAPCAEC
ncbi:DUF2116 family Zn-ribbon domain-containing protein [Uliginosibacterium gangwonense]|uniref:DUF2116 family Zn-ribbon domain-containing protein n=1 Tax=Uliginosibacterium gangwonense TaxID=392736 RepID=UPI000362E2F2|nr:DUF2116 family Zn-ribbon domain-containing protein [Uliginosibacterium gangwonense]